MRCLGNNIRTTVNNLTVSYNDEGPDEAPVIIFIHGFPLNKSLWNAQMEALKHHYRVIAYDVRGHGSTDTGNKDYSIDVFTQDLIGLMDKLELDKVTLCGLSMGGYIALNAIEKYPERFEALVLSDTQCVADTPEVKEKRMKTIKSIKENGVEKFAAESVKNLFASESFITNQEEINAVREMIMNISEQSLCNTLLAIAMRNETCSQLQAINVPVQIMVGKEDTVTPPAASQMMYGKIQNSFFNIIEHAGHLSNLENPYEFNYHLKKFVHQFAKGPLRASDAAFN